MRRAPFGVGLILVLALAVIAPWPLASQAPRCAKPVDVCIAEKHRAFANRGVLGFLWAPVGEGERVPHLNRLEYLVRAVPPGYPALAAGLKEGDLLLEMNGKSLLGVPAETLKQMQEAVTVGQAVVYKVLRNDKRLEVQIVAGKPDARSVEAWVAQHVHDTHSQEEYRRYLQTVRTSPSGRPPQPHP